MGIPGGSAFPGPATATYTEISRHLFSASYEITAISDLLSSVKVNYFTQYIQRDVEMVPNTVTETKIPAGTQRVTPELVVPIGNHLTHGGQLQTTWTPGKKNTLIAGVDIWSRTMRTNRTKYIRNEVVNPAGNVVKTINLVRGETPIPKSSFSSGGIFVQDEARLLNDRLTLITGGRVDGIVVENEAGTDIDYLIVDGVRNDTPPNQRITFPAGKNNTLSWSANAGMLVQGDQRNRPDAQPGPLLQGPLARRTLQIHRPGELCQSGGSGVETRKRRFRRCGHPDLETPV